MSVPAPPVIVKPSVCALKLTLEPAVLARTVSIFLKLASEAKTWEPADNCKVSEPAPPSKISRLPSPELIIVKVSLPLLPLKLSLPAPPIRLNPPDDDKLRSIVLPVEAAIRLAVPKLLVVSVEVYEERGSVVISVPEDKIKISPVFRSLIFIFPLNTTKVSLPPFPLTVSVSAPNVI